MAFLTWKIYHSKLLDALSDGPPFVSQSLNGNKQITFQSLKLIQEHIQWAAQMAADETSPGMARRTLAVNQRST